MTEEPDRKEGNWYVIQTLANKEASVKRHLDRYLENEEMEDFIFEIIMPTETVTEVKNGKKTSRVRKLYPCYVFIRAELYDENGKLRQKPWHYVCGTDGVIGFIGKENPVPLKLAEIKRIEEQIAAAEGKEVPKVMFSVGEEVKITDGPFLNLTGKIEEIDAENQELKVSVSIFGRFTPLELQFWQVERAEEN